MQTISRCIVLAQPHNNSKSFPEVANPAGFLLLCTYMFIPLFLSPCLPLSLSFSLSFIAGSFISFMSHFQCQRELSLTPPFYPLTLFGMAPFYFLRRTSYSVKGLIHSLTHSFTLSPSVSSYQSDSFVTAGS